MSLREEEAARLEKLDNLRKQGIDPYPARTERTHTIAEVARNWDPLESSKKTVTLVGRLRSKREHGGLLFAHLEDGTGKLQLAFKKDILGKDAFTFFDAHFDVADFIFAHGTLFKTKRGEPTLLVEKYGMLAKALAPLPEKWHGLTDTEIRFRKRYLDLIMNPEVRTRLELRSKIITALRTFMDGQGFLEVETPTLQPVYGGGLARPFTTHHHALGRDFYLRISDEMYLKRLLVGGIDGVYEITKVFRNEGIDRDHNPEFTMFEAQVAYKDYRWGMDIFEEIFAYTAKTVFNTTAITYEDTTLEYRRPWHRLRLADAVKAATKLDLEASKTAADARRALEGRIGDQKKKTELKRLGSVGEILAFAFEELVEATLIQPTIIYDYPVEVSPLAKKCADPRYVERFEAFVYGREVGNNYSELNDPLDLEARFMEEKKRANAGAPETHQTDEDYLDAIKHGMPPACGLGIGVDRMVMFMTNAKNIKEVIVFPTLRPEA